MADAATDRRSLTPFLMVLAAGCTIMVIVYGIRTSFGLFMQPISAGFGWGREAFALAIAIQNLVWGVTQPFSGALADRYGSGRVMAAGATLFAIGIFAMSMVTTPLGAQMSIGVVVGLGLSGTGFAAVQSAIGKAAPERWRALALGIGGAAGSFGQFVLVPLGQSFIEAYGWQSVLTMYAAALLLIVPMTAAIRRNAVQAAAGPAQTMREALSEARAHLGYRFLIAGFFVCGFHVTFMATHLPAYVVDKGLSPHVGAWAIGLVGLFNIFGSLLAGILGSRLSKKYLLSFLYMARATVITIFVLTPISELSVLVFAATMGLLWLSTVPLTTALVAQIFGTRYLSTLFGIVFMSHQFGSFAGAWAGGFVFDATGSYTLMWWIAVALGVLSSALHWPIDERPVARPAPA
ncbi:MAG: MFS transporter [Alphaproteobacteria bacterium]